MADKDPGFGQPKERISFTRSGLDAESSVLWTSTNAFIGRQNPTTEDKQNVVKINQNGELLKTAKHSPLNTWKRVDAGISFGAGEGSMNPQRIISNLLDLREGQDVMWFDMENLGTHKGKKPDNMKWYMPTEIAISHQKVKSDFTMADGERGNVSMLIKPTEEVEDRLDKLITRAEGMMKNRNWNGLTQDERRTLNDLILYGSDDPFGSKGGLKIFDSSRGFTQVVNQNRLAQAPNEFIFQATHLKAMRQGLRNLSEYGTTSKDVAAQLIGMFNGLGQDYKLGGFNIQNFDMPMMRDYIKDTLMPAVKDDKTMYRSLHRVHRMFKNGKDIDTRQAYNVLFKDQGFQSGVRLTQSDIAESLGLDVKKAHLGIEDIKLNIQVHNELIKQRGMMDVVHKKKTAGLIADWDSKPLEQGDRLYSVNGLPGYQAGKFDAVYQQAKDGSFHAQYDMKMNPIFKNSVYSLHKEYDGITLADGNKYYGMMLKNEDTNGYHFIARESKEALQNVVHQTMVPAAEAIPFAMEGQQMQDMDRARRKYLKMFSDDPSGGRKLINKTFSALDALEEGQKQGLNNKELADFIANYDGVATQYKDMKTGKVMRHQATPEFVRDFMNMKDRVAAERPYLEEFLKKLDQNFPAKNGQYPGAQSVALQQFRYIMDEKFGKNVMNVESTSTIPITVESKKHPITGQVIEEDIRYINARSKQSIESGIRNITRGAGNDMEARKKRLRKVVQQARQTGVSGLTKLDMDQLNDLINDLKPGDSDYVVTSEIAARIQRQYNHHAKMGLNTISIEDPTKMTAERAEALKKDWGTTGKDVMNEAIARTKVYEQKAWLKGGKLNIYDPKLSKVIGEHNQSMERLWKQAGFGKSSLPSVKAEQTLKHLTNAFNKDGYETALIWDNRKKSMNLVMAHESVAQKIFRMKPNEILEHSKVASVAVPTLDGKGNIVMPGQQKVAYTKVFHDFEGKPYVGSAFESAILGLTGRAKRAREMMNDGKKADVESMLKGAVRNAVESFSANNQYMSRESEFDDKKSAGARYTRSRYADVVGFAEEWYKNVHPDKSTAKIRQKMESEYLTFFQAMPAQEQTQFLHGVAKWANDKYGTNLDMHSVKDVKAMNSVLSTAAGDVRHLIPFGHYNPTARENMPKAVNYVPLDEAEARKRLQNRNVSEDKIDRMMKQGLVTEEAQKFLRTEDGAEEKNWLNLRTAYVETADLTEMMKKSGVDNARYSTYDGAFLIAEDVADAFTFTRTRNIKLGDGGKPTDRISKLFNDALANDQATIDEHGNIMLNEPNKHQLKHYAKMNTQEGSASYGKYTVGSVATQDVLHGTTHQTVYIQGYNAEKNSIQIGEVEMINNGTKMGTDSGDRITATIVPREDLHKMGLGDVDAILPEQSEGKAMHGAKVRSQVALVLDQMQEIAQNSSKVTTGEITKAQLMQEAAEQVESMMNRHLNTEGALSIKDGRIVMDTNKLIEKGSKISIDGLHGFMEEADIRLANLANTHGQEFTPNLSQQFRRGVEGFSRSDVYEWHNSIGRVDGDKDGLVRYGYKEVEAFEKRANHLLGKGNAVTGWLRDHIRKASIAQSGTDIESVENYVRGVTRSVLDVTDEDLVHGKVRAGEVVIKTQGNAFDFNDREGAKAVRLENGVAEVSMHALAPLPEKTQPGQVFTAKHYARTILDVGGAFKDIDTDTEGRPVDLDDMFKKNGGTVLFELPDDTFSRSHVRFIDDNVAQIGTNDEGMAVMKELQKAKMAIFRGTKEYQANTNEDTRAKLQGAIDTYESKIAHVVSSARDGSIQDMRSARLDMSGRFNAQVINPMVESDYKEGTIYLGEKRAMDMIRGAEKQVAQAVGIETEGLGKQEIKSKVLEHMKTNGLYGLVNRYPTIAEDTGQILNVKVDESLDTEAKRLAKEQGLDPHSAYFKSGYVTVGTAARMNMDYDGDFFSTIFAHYKDGNASAIHEDMGKIFEVDQPRLEEEGAKVIADLENDAAKKGMTVGRLWKDEDYRNKFIQDQSGNVEWGIKTGDLYDKETQTARLGKGNVGVLDNLRQKLRNIAGENYSILERAGVITEEEAYKKIDILEQFGRAASQKAISSKKFSVEALTKQVKEEGGFEPDQIEAEVSRRMDAMDEGVQLLKEGIANPDAEGRRKIVQANNILDFLKGNDYNMDESLDALSEAHKLSGGHRWVQNSYQGYMSEGVSDIEKLSNQLRGYSGDQMIMSPGAEMAMESSPVSSQAMEEGKERYAKNVLSNYHNMQENSETLTRMIDKTAVETTEHVLDGMTSAERTGASLKSMVSKFTPSLGEGGTGKAAMVGAGMFGALWATSALMRSGPTPEGMKEQAPPPAPNSMPKAPTARVTPQGEHININISASDAKRMSQDEIAALVHQELSGMTQMNMNVNMNVNDNTQKLDQGFLQDIVNKAVGNGYIF